jgi:hypothetical protein
VIAWVKSAKASGLVPGSSALCEYVRPANSNTGRSQLPAVRAQSSTFNSTTPSATATAPPPPHHRRLLPPHMPANASCSRRALPGATLAGCSTYPRQPSTSAASEQRAASSEQ